MTASTNEVDRQILTIRVMDAPRELVWKALSDPAHLMHWVGAKGI